MNRLFKSLFTVTAVSLATTATADTIFGENVAINASGIGSTNSDDRLCIGDNCVDGETYSGSFVKLKLKDESVSILFDDVNSSNPSWELIANPSGIDGFDIREVGGGAIFRLEGDAPSNSLFVDDGGNIGLGTSLPQHNIHMARFGGATIRFEDTQTSPQIWDVVGNEFNFYLRDASTDTFPFMVNQGAPTDALFIRHNGNIGLGTSMPNAQLELSSTESFNFFRITAEGADTNESVDITFTGGPLGTGQLRYNIVDGDNQEMSLDADGNMVLDGTLTTAGPTCSGGCDRVFDADYALPSIETRALAMFDNGHLPALGPTSPGRPLNVTETLGNMLNELEHAHIYITQLNTELSDVKAARAQDAKHMAAQEETLRALLARIERLEAPQIR